MTQNRCLRELKELLPWYVNETLAGNERARVEAHLVGCEGCRKELKELQGLKQLVVIATDEDVAVPWEGLLAQTIERIHSGERRTIAQLNWQLFALGFTLGVLYERGRIKIEPEVEALGWELRRRRG